MNIETELKKKYPDKSDREITAIRVDAFNKLFNSQSNFWNWKYKKVIPYYTTLLRVCNELNLNIKELDYEN